MAMVKQQPAIVSSSRAEFESEYLSKCASLDFKPFSLLAAPVIEANQGQAMLLKECLSVDDAGELTVRSYTVTPMHLEIIANLSTTTEYLTKLNFWRCKISNDGLKIISALIAKGHVEHLQLDDNLSHSNDDPHIFANLVNCSIGNNNNNQLLQQQQLPSACKLKFLSLRSNHITDVQAVELFKVLEMGYSSNLAFLNLWNNRIGNVGAKALAECLKVNRTLLGVSLGRNCISDAGAIEISKAMTRFEVSSAEQEKILADRESSSRNNFERRKSIQELGMQMARSPSKKNLDKDAANKKSTSKISAPGKDVKASTKKLEATSGSLKRETAKSLSPPKQQQQQTLSLQPSGSGKGGAGKEDAGVPSGFETVNGVTYSLGNRALLFLNFSHNPLTNSAKEAFQKVTAAEYPEFKISF